MKNSVPLFVVLSLLVGSLNVGSYNPHNELSVLSTNRAEAQFTFPDLPDLPDPVIRTCSITASESTVAPGEAFTITWNTNGFDRVFINGVEVASVNGTQTLSIEQNETFNLIAQTADGTSNCTARVTVSCIPVVVPPPTCTLEPRNGTVNSGDSFNLNWTTTNAETVTLTGFGAVATTSGSVVAGPITQNTTYTLLVLGLDGSNVTCTSTVTVSAVPTPSCDTFTATPSALPVGGGAVTLAWTTTNATAVTISPVVGSVSPDGSTTVNVTQDQLYTLTASGTDGTSVSCTVAVTVATPNPVPSCDAFTATPGSIVRGGQSLLSWNTTNATRVVIDNGVGEVATSSGTFTVAPLATTTYTMVVFGTNGQQVSCAAPVIVTEPPADTVPSCDVFTATPTSLPVGGGAVTLSWLVNNASTTTISPTVGTVANSGTTSVAVTQNQTFTLTAADADGDTNSCTVAVTVATPEVTPFTCQNDVQFTASDRSIVRGNDSTLTWSTSNRVTAVRFNQGITATGLSGSTTVAPDITTEYVLSATVGTTTLACPLIVEVSGGGGGGGGGSASLRCEFSISDNRIARGERVTLRWDSSRATNLKIENVTTDDTLVTTENVLSTEKDELFDGTLTVRPDRDTDYLLTVTRGTRERTCRVSVDVEGNVLSEVRDQPLVTSIALTDVPYTGFEAGPILTFIFYFLLMLWALYIAYILVVRRDVLGGMKLATAMVPASVPKMTQEEIRPDVFVAVRPPQVAPSTLPTNLPTGVLPTVGYGTATSLVENDEQESATMTMIENRAHAEHVLISSDAIRYFMTTIKGNDARVAALNQVLTLAKTQYPSEDGWVVLNEKRMQTVCEACIATAPVISSVQIPPTVLPEGAGSLAEAIVIGNVVAAYELIGNRAMFALADAAADLDAVYKIRRGMQANASELLMTATAGLTNDQILQMIQALTGALDGTYSDEASAVKMAIMKAIKVVA